MLACMKSVTNSENQSRIHFKKLVTAFISCLCLYKLLRKPPMSLTIVPKPGYEWTLEKSTDDRKEKHEQKFWSCFEKNLQTETLKLFLSFTRHPKSFEAKTEGTVLAS